jgi:hypothetical protein
MQDAQIAGCCRGPASKLHGIEKLSHNGRMDLVDRYDYGGSGQRLAPSSKTEAQRH